jgi:hypothetical protein
VLAFVQEIDSLLDTESAKVAAQEGHMNARLVYSLFLLFSAAAFGQSNTQPQQTPPERTRDLLEAQKYQQKPRDGYIPDMRTAVRVAEAVMIPIYGARLVASEKPFHATLDGDVWTVSGTMGCKTTAHSICVGGTAVMQLSKATGEILLSVHEE